MSHGLNIRELHVEGFTTHYGAFRQNPMLTANALHRKDTQHQERVGVITHLNSIKYYKECKECLKGNIGET